MALGLLLDRYSDYRHMIPSNEVHMSVGEMLRTISAITNRDVAADLFSKPEKMDEVVWQLITIYFDMPPRQFKPTHMLILLNKMVEELHFSHPICISDLGENRDKKKWLALLSITLKCIQFKINFQEGTKIYNDVLSVKADYSQLYETVADREKKIAAKRTEIRVQQGRIEQLTQQLDEASALNEKSEKENSALVDRLGMLEESNVKLSEHITSIEKENVELESECELASKGILQNVETLPESIALMKDRLHGVEAEMHSLFEALTSVVERTTLFQHFELLLDQLQECLDKIYSLLDKYKEFKGQEKTKQSERNKALAELEEQRSEQEIRSRTLVDLQNQTMRQRLLLANKKKALQAKKRNFSKEIDSIKAETQEYQDLLRQLLQKALLFEEQLKLGQAEEDKIDQRLPLINKLGRLLVDLHSILSNTN